ncbi:RHS repeat-associated core domain-containing protein [Pirellulaceae bacterium SH467]
MLFLISGRYAPPTASTSADTIQQVDITYVTTSGLPKGLVATETVQTGRTSGTRVTTYQSINTPSDPARHARVSSITETGDSVNAVTSFTYDNRGNISSVTDPAGRVTKFWHDNRDRLIATMSPDPDGTGSLLPVLTRYDYDSHDNLIASELINSRVEGTKLYVTALITSYTYDALGRQTSTFTQRPDLEWHLTYSSSTVGLTSTKPSSTSPITTSILEAYAAANSRIVNTPASNSSYRGLVSEVSYFGTANIVTETISNNGSDSRVFKTEYDLLNRPVKSITPAPGSGYTSKTGEQLESGGIVSRVEYDNLGNIVASRDGLNNLTKFTYDDLNRVNSIGTPHPTTSGSTLDTAIEYFESAKGWITKSNDPLGIKTFAESDMLGRTVRVSGSGVSTQSVSYWKDGLLKSTTDGFGQVTDYAYDRQGRLTSVTAPAATSGGTRPVSNWTYSVDSLLSTVVDPLSRTTTYQYDAGGRIQSVVSPDPDGTGSLASAYSKVLRDSVGNVMASTDAVNEPLGNWNLFTYDSWFRNTSSIDALGAVTSTNFDVFGNVTSVVDPLNNTTSYTYNKLQQLVTENKGTDRSFSYDANGNLATLTDRNTRHSFDSAGRLKSITHSKTELGAGVNWDGTSSLPSTGTFAAYFLNYDADNRIASLASRADGFVTNFTYDIIDQLTAATTSAISGLTMPFSPTAESYNLDENGNRKSSGGASQSASGTHNRLQTDGTYNYTYDNEGNVTRRTKISDSTVTDYTWDYRNRLATVTDKDSASGATLKQVEYTYDAFDQRTAKRVDTDGNGTWDRYEVYTWADGQEVQRWVDTDGAGTGQKLRLANRYLWAESVDQLLSDEQYASGTGMEIDATTASGTAGTTLWALTDHLGSVRDLLDNNGVVREHNVFDSFGRLIREVDYNSSGTAISSTDAAAVDSIFGYTGRDWDSDIGMQYNRARWYDPQTGRWLSQDPIGFAAGDSNLYRYVGNRATTHIDPSGLADWIPPELWAYPGKVGQFWKGYFWNGPVNVVTGTASAAYNYDDTWEGIKGAVADPAAAASAIGNEYYEKSLSTEGQGEICFDIATAVVGATKAAKASKLKNLKKLTDKVEVDIPNSASSRGAQLRDKYGSQFGEYMHFRGQGFTPAQSKYLTQPYSGRAGHHFPIPQRTGRDWNIPRSIIDSRFNVLRPTDMSIGRFYELHYRVDPFFHGTRFPQAIGGTWRGGQLGLERYSGLQKIWYSTPCPTKIGVGVGLGTGAAGAGYWWFSDDSE